MSTVETGVEIRRFQVEFSEDDVVALADGNHFAASQEPEIFSNELRAAFASLR